MNGHQKVVFSHLIGALKSPRNLNGYRADYALEGLQTEQGIVDRVPELKKLSENIDKATNTWVNATLQLESAIQQYQRAELKLDDAVNSISGKVGTINTHIDNILKEAPTKLQVSVNVSDADWQKIQNKFN